ncbi:LysR family transcriptional regulator [Nocardioides albus]|uniref:DNA-binding transcriptional LysR family regulator n=1 Tax=Nocardioides albus TaxID=1841 RepID=A0A7W5A5R4_9ACTN|nr:LysR family transcriptional regulator [Nocardioides albus]MBB3089729.1 DNA-binding transcriptional LysR family regulator [Nocardioides albus]
MDIEDTCRAFLAVSEAGGFTLGAAKIGAPQPVVSRRVAALEARVGGRVFDRSAQNAGLTPLGRRLLPSVRRVIEAVDELVTAADVDAPRRLRLAFPEDVPTVRGAALISDAKEESVDLVLVMGGPERRAELVRSAMVDGALLPAPDGLARWRAPLGLASAAPSANTRIHLDRLRPGRLECDPPRRVILSPEDDHAYVGDVLRRHAFASGLRPDQVHVAALVSALADVTTSHDLLLCTELQARELALSWHQIGGIVLARNFTLEVCRRMAPDGVGWPSAEAGWLDAAVGHALGCQPGAA